jgi:hypothetical protein
MKLWQVASTVAVGVWASGSGFVQAQAADYVFFTDFSTKEVANFNDFTPTFLPTTGDLDNSITWTFNTFYRMNACPPSVASDAYLELTYTLKPINQKFFSGLAELPDMPCRTTNTYYQTLVEFSIPIEHLEYIISDDSNFIEFAPVFAVRFNPSAPSRSITLTDPEFVFSVEYDFNTTYLFNYFLSQTRDYGIFPINSSITGNIISDFDYVMTTAGNDRYFIINDRLTDFGTGIKRFAIDYEDEYFRGESVGARYKQVVDGIIKLPLTTGLSAFYGVFEYFYLNTSNKQQDIQNVPEFEYEYEDCGSFLALNVPCFINNGLAYVVNDAPVISDAFTLLNAGMKLGGQAFSIIGQFSDNNLFGVLVLGGLGITAVRWFLKQD